MKYKTTIAHLCLFILLLFGVKDNSPDIAHASPRGALSNTLYSTFLGNGDLDRSKGVAIDSSGNAYVVGHSETTWGNPIRAHAGGVSDGFVAKVDTNGALVWLTFLGSSDIDESLAVALDSSGNVYVTGQSFESWGTPIDAYVNSASDGFIAKLDNDGNLLWNTFVGSTGNDWAQAITIDSTGNVYVAGTSEATWGNPVNAYSGTTGNDQAYIVKLDADGTRLWNTFMGSATGNTISRAIALDGKGKVYAGGQSFESWGTPVTAFSGGIEDAFIAQVDANGDRLWNTFVGGTGDDVIYGLAVDSTDNIIATGFTAASWGSPVAPYGGGDFEAFVAKFGSGGVPQWHTYLGGPGRDSGRSLVADSNDDIVVSGSSTSGWGCASSLHAGEPNDAFVAKLNGQGIRQWNTFVGGSSDDRSSDVSIDSNGNIFLVGNSAGSWGAPVNAYSGGEDAFAAKLNNLACPPTTPVAENDSYNTPEDTPLSVAAPGVLDNDSDADGDSLMAVLESNPSSGSLSLQLDGSFHYTPSLNFVGEDTFTYKASDGINLSNEVTVTITISDLVEKDVRPLMTEAIESIAYDPLATSHASLGELIVDFKFTYVSGSPLDNISFTINKADQSVVVNTDQGVGGVGSTLTILNMDLPGDNSKFEEGEDLVVQFVIGIEASPWGVDFDMFGSDGEIAPAAAGVSIYSFSIDNTIFDLDAISSQRSASHTFIFLPLVSK